MNDRLNGRVALVTGAASGLGQATARALARAGCAVACVDVNAAGAEQTAAELRADGATCAALPCDVSDAEAVFATVGAAAERLGRLDIVVSCAAIDHTLSVDELTVEQWDKVIGVNLRGPFLLAKAAMPIMRRQRWGYLVNIASTAATRAWANAAPYHASKWGLVGFGRGLGVEGRPDNIRVTTIIPGGMRTHFFDRFVEQGIPMPDERNLQDPADVADTIVFVLSRPEHSIVQELIVTPPTEPSWP
jgi:NAD(P)-dependent dehydrogenase (short-subunit alcohol dehydrogenase family)